MLLITVITIKSVRSHDFGKYVQYMYMVGIVFKDIFHIEPFSKKS